MPLPNEIVSLLQKDPVTLVDIGARGGINNFRHLASWINVHAFEADAEESEKLRRNKNPFASYTVHPFALAGVEGKRIFHLAHKRSFSSFLPFDKEEFKKHFGRMKDAEKWSEGFKVEKNVEVNCKTLDAVFTSQIDYLKLDTQGTELEILHGAKDLLVQKKISVIEVEVNMQPVYVGQPAFSVIDQFLRNAGFLLVDYKINQHAFSPVNSNNSLTENPRIANGGDAIYVLNMNLISENERDDKALKAALLLAHNGYLSISENLLRTFTKTNDIDIAAIFSTLNRKSAKERRKNFARKWLPPGLISLLK
jgi:FkbM family methyltransferase